MAERVTIRSVANEAGVSIATVSNVLNGRHEQMAAATLLRVQDAIERLGYRPNHLAQSLVTNRTATIGLIISELTNSLYPPVILGAEAACRTAGHSLLLASAPDVDAERRIVEVMRRKQVDGLILFSVSFLDIANEHILRAEREGTPVVVINRQVPNDAPLSQVYFDHFGGARQATRHLLDLGHRRIAHIAGPAHRFTGVHRRGGYLAALGEAGIEADERLIAEGDYTFESGQRLIRRLWRERPTAVFVAGDAMALGALRALAELGLRVPADVSLVAFGNPDLVRYATPAITTIDLPVEQAGQAAAELVLCRIGRLDEKEVRTLETTLLIRETTAPLSS
jgi:LacI family transcriptional regulator